jgi:hypothetical protein
MADEKKCYKVQMVVHTGRLFYIKAKDEDQAIDKAYTLAEAESESVDWELADGGEGIQEVEEKEAAEEGYQVIDAE